MSRPHVGLGVVLIEGADAVSSGVTDQSIPLPVVTPHHAVPDGVTHWAVVPPGVRLLPDFTSHMTAALADGAASAYCDFTVQGHRIHVGEWSVERSRWQAYTGPVMVVPAGTDPALAPWRRLEQPRRTGHATYVPQVLYTSVTDQISEITASQRSLIWSELPYSWDVSGRRHLSTTPRVSIVIPTRGASRVVRGRRARFIDTCLASLASDLSAPEVDLVVVTGTDDEHRYLDRWQEALGTRMQITTVAPPFNFAERINAGAAMAHGEYLVFLNDDVAVITPHWLAELVALASEPAVGAVGARLLHEDGTVQHGGHVFHGGGVHLLDSGDTDTAGPRERNEIDRDVSGVTAACLVQRRDVWQQLGGMDPAFPVAFNDVDYCERMRAAGLRIVVCNSVRMHHFESRSRAGTARQPEVDLLRSRWASSLDSPDPFTPDWEPRPRRRRLRDRLTARLRRNPSSLG